MIPSLSILPSSIRDFLNNSFDLEEFAATLSEDEILEVFIITLMIAFLVCFTLGVWYCNSVFFRRCRRSRSDSTPSVRPFEIPVRLSSKYVEVAEGDDLSAFVQRVALAFDLSDLPAYFDTSCLRLHRRGGQGRDRYVRSFKDLVPRHAYTIRPVSAEMLEKRASRKSRSFLRFNPTRYTFSRCQLCGHRGPKGSGRPTSPLKPERKNDTNTDATTFPDTSLSLTSTEPTALTDLMSRGFAREAQASPPPEYVPSPTSRRRKRLKDDDSDEHSDNARSEEEKAFTELLEDVRDDEVEVGERGVVGRLRRERRGGRGEEVLDEQGRVHQAEMDEWLALGVDEEEEEELGEAGEEFES